MTEPNLRTRYEFTLPRGYVDREGRMHKTGIMRLATARDELDPLRDPTVNGPDDPRLTILVLARVIEQLGDMQAVTIADVENLFAVDLAFLQDFYGVINFGTQEEFEALVSAQQESQLVGTVAQSRRPAPPPVPDEIDEVEQIEDGDADPSEQREDAPSRPLRAAVEEMPRRAQ